MRKTILRIHSGCTMEILSICAPCQFRLFSFSQIAGQLIEPFATAEQFDIEHQFITGSHFQLLIDTAVMLFYGMNADICEVRNICRLVTVNVVI